MANGETDSFFTYCDRCNKVINVEITCSDTNFLGTLISMACLVKTTCSSCASPEAVQVQESPFEHPGISRVQLESYEILMAELIGFELDAKLEWPQAINLQALLKAFGYHCKELDDKLADPNNAIISRGSMWIELSYQSCCEIQKAMKEKGL